MDYANLTFKEKKILKVLLLNDLIFFIRFFFKVTTGEEFIVNWHHKEIAKNLNDIYLRIFDNLVLNIPPRHSKSTLMAYFTAWSLAKNPQSLFLYISASDKLSSENSRIVRQIVMHPIYKELFNVSLSADSTAKNHWKTGQGGGITATTINGQITGFGAGSILDDTKFYGAIIIDDPNKISAQYSNIESQIPNLRFVDTIQSRRNGKRTPIILIQQRAFVGDLSDFIISKKAGLIDVRVVIMPIIFEGKPLWEAKFGLKEIEGIKNNPETQHVFQSQYMQNPQKLEGVLFNSVKMNYFNLKDIENKEPEIIVSHCDVANEGDDFLCNILGYVFGNKLFIIDVIFTQEDERITKPLIINQFNVYKPNFALFESNNQGTLFANDILKLTKNEENFKPQIIKYPNTQNKISRIISQAAWIMQNCYFIDIKEQTPTYKNFFNQLLDFNKIGKNRHDDAPDSLSGLVNFLRIKFNK